MGVRWCEFISSITEACRWWGVCSRITDKGYLTQKGYKHLKFCPIAHFKFYIKIYTGKSCAVFVKVVSCYYLISWTLKMWDMLLVGCQERFPTEILSDLGHKEPMTVSQRKPRSRGWMFFAKEIALTKAGAQEVVGWKVDLFVIPMKVTRDIESITKPWL